MNAAVRRRTGQLSARRRAREAVAGVRRSSILEAARTVFARRGFADTTVDLIARAAGMAKGTVYLYYPSKTAIYSAAVVQGLRELAAETAGVLESPRAIRSVLRDFFLARLRYVDQHGDIFRIYSVEAVNLGRAATHIRQEYARLNALQVESLARALKAAARAGDIRAVDARTVATAVFDLSHALVVRRVRGASGRPESEVGAVLDLLWKGIEKR